MIGTRHILSKAHQEILNWMVLKERNYSSLWILPGDGLGLMTMQFGLFRVRSYKLSESPG